MPIRKKLQFLVVIELGYNRNGYRKNENTMKSFYDTHLITNTHRNNVPDSF